jgi:peroxiredoxin
MNTSSKRLFALIAAGSVALIGSAALAQDKGGKPAEAPATAPQEKAPKEKTEPKKDEKATKASGPAVGAPAPDFTLTDLEGKTWTLSSLTKEGKIVVLQWFNPDCPFVVKHYKDANTFNDLHSTYKDKGVVLIAINSAAPGLQGAGKDRNAKAKTDWKIEYPVLLDEAGEVGHKYGAKNTPAMYIINKDGVLAYKGAIDDEPGAGKVGKTNYVTKALDEIIAGTNVTTTETKPYGCKVKYKGE